MVKNLICGLAEGVDYAKNMVSTRRIAPVSSLHFPANSAHAHALSLFSDLMLNSLAVVILPGARSVGQCGRRDS